LQKNARSATSAGVLNIFAGWRDISSLRGKTNMPIAFTIAGRSPRNASTAMAIGHRMEFVIAGADPATAIAPVIIAAAAFHLAANQRARAKTDRATNRRTATAIRDAANGRTAETADHGATSGTAAPLSVSLAQGKNSNQSGQQDCKRITTH
jgi:hypothetical protein